MAHLNTHLLLRERASVDKALQQAAEARAELASSRTRDDAVRGLVCTLQIEVASLLRVAEEHADATARSAEEEWRREVMEARREVKEASIHAMAQV